MLLERPPEASSASETPPVADMFQFLMSFYFAADPSPQAIECKLSSLEKIAQYYEPEWLEEQRNTRPQEYFRSLADRPDAGISSTVKGSRPLAAERTARIEHYQLFGSEHCEDCSMKVAKGYTRITRVDPLDFYTYIKLDGNDGITKRKTYTIFPYFGFHALGRHDSYTGSGEKSGRVELNGRALQRFFTEDLPELDAPTVTPGTAFFRVFNSYPQTVEKT